jgi:hypothetical protein
MYGCDGYGKVDTRPGMGASYYHLIYWDSFLHDHISLLFLVYFRHGLSFLSLFLSCLEHVSLSSSSSFLHSPCLFFKDIFGERDHIWSFILWNGWMIQR